MSNISSDNDTVECNCLPNLHVNTINFVNGEVNNNSISIDATERTNNNTVVIIYDKNLDPNTNESNCEKAVQTDPELASCSEDILVDKTTNMDKDRNDSNKFPPRSNVNNVSNFKSVQTNENGVIDIEEFQSLYSDFHARSNNEINNAKGTNKNVIENKNMRPQNLSLSDGRYMDKNVPVNNPTTDNSQITKLLNHSERNKAVINSVITKYMSTINKNSPSKFIDAFTGISPSNKLALNQVLDRIRKESPNVEMTEGNNVDAHTQTEVVQNSHKSTQTDPEFPNTYYNNCTINMELNCMAIREFLRESKIYFEEFQNKLQYLFLQYTIQSKDQKEKLNNISHQPICDMEANTSSSGTNDKVDNAVANIRDNASIDNNVSNRSIAGNTANLGNNTNNSRHVGAIGNGNHASNTQNNNTGADNNNNDRAYNTVNPMPRQEAMMQEEQAPVMQSQAQFSAIQSPHTRAGRPRNEMSSSRFSPYPRQQFWQQSEYNSRHRQLQHMHECHSAMQAQHNTLIRQYNGWQTPNPPNNQSFFTPHHHHHHF